jgi:hypothetical protein
MRRFWRWAWAPGHRYSRLVGTAFVLFFAWAIAMESYGAIDLTGLRPARYQIIQIIGGGLVVRLDTRTGEMRAYVVTPGAAPTRDINFHEVARRLPDSN